MIDPKFPEITLVIQGKFNEFATSDSKYNTYKRYFKHIIVSTWDNESFAGPVIENIATQYRIDRVDRYSGLCQQNNLGVHVWSTLNGLSLVKTRYAIKIRGDEYREKLDEFCRKVVTSNKFVCDNCHFVRDREQKFHVGDHTIGSSTSNLIRMFSTIANRLDTLKNGFLPSTFGMDDDTNMPVHTMFGIAGSLVKSPFVTMKDSIFHVKRSFDVVPVHHMGRVAIHSNGIDFDRTSEFYAKFPGNINEIGEVST